MSSEMETRRRERDSALVTTGDADGFGSSGGACRGGLASDFGSGSCCGSGYVHSLNQCRTSPCVVGACHNSGAVASLAGQIRPGSP